MNHAWSTLAYSQLVPAVPAQVQPPSAAAASWRRRNSAAVTNHTSVTDPGTAAHHGLHPSPRQNSPSSSCIQPCTPPAGRYMPPPNRGWRRGRHRTRHAQRSTPLATVPASSARRCLPLTLHHDQPALPCCLRRLTSRRRARAAPATDIDGRNPKCPHFEITTIGLTGLVSHRRRFNNMFPRAPRTLRFRFGIRAQYCCFRSPRHGLPRLRLLLAHHHRGTPVRDGGRRCWHDCTSTVSCCRCSECVGSRRVRRRRYAAGAHRRE